MLWEPGDERNENREMDDEIAKGMSTVKLTYELFELQ